MGSPERLPDPTAEEVNEVVYVLRRALDGGRFEVFTDEEGRFCWQPVERGEVTKIKDTSAKRSG